MIDRIGEIILAERKARGLSRKQLELRSHVAENIIIRIEKGRVHSRIDTLEMLLKAMGLRLTVEEIPQGGKDQS